MTELERLFQYLIDGKHAEFNALCLDLNRPQLSLPTRRQPSGDQITLTGRDFSQFKLKGVTMTDLHFSKCVFGGEEVGDVELKKCTLEECTFRPTGREGMNFTSSRFEGGRFEGVAMATFKMVGCIFTEDTNEEPQPVFFDEKCRFKGFSARGNGWGHVRVDSNAEGKILEELCLLGISYPKPPKQIEPAKAPKKVAGTVTVKKRSLPKKAAHGG